MQDLPNARLSKNATDYPSRLFALHPIPLALYPSQTRPTLRSSQKSPAVCYRYVH